MGTWGAGIFDCDLGEDVKATFREYIADGVSVENAVLRLIEGYDIDDPDEGSNFWLTLAATQVQTGRLTELVKERALEVIENGAGLEAFAQDCPEELPARKRAIQRLEKKILGPQKKPTKIKKAFVDTIEWESGDGLAYQLPSRMWTGLKVRKVERDPKHQEADYEVLDLYQDTMPTAEEMVKASVHLSRGTIHDLQDIKKMKCEIDEAYKNRSTIFRKCIHLKNSNIYDLRKRRAMGVSVITLCRSGVRDKPDGELVRVAQGLKWEDYKNCVNVCFGGWKELDRYLEEDHGLK